jgi:hypothetical protein
VKIKCGNNSYSTNQDILKCVDISQVANYNCPSNFSKIAQTCSHTDPNSRYNNALAYSLYEEIIAEHANVHLSLGYNLIEFNESLLAEPGTVFMIKPDCHLPVTSFSPAGLGDAYTLDNMIMLPLAGSLMARLIVQPLEKRISTLKKYSAVGNYTITVNISNVYNASQFRSNSATIRVLDGIQGLTLGTQNSTCEINQPFFILSNVTQGSNIVYYWSINGVSVSNATSSSISYTFAQLGSNLIELIAQNEVSRRKTQLYVDVKTRLSGLAFYSGQQTQSTSKLGQPAQFLFKLAQGNGYKCDVSFGDGSALLSFYDLPYDLNNTLIPHAYANVEHSYAVSIHCDNSLNAASLTFNHYVQYEILDVRLAKNGAVANAAYSIEFMIGSSASSSLNLFLYVDGLLDTGLSLQSRDASTTPNQLYYKSTARMAQIAPLIHKIRILAYNYVSRIELNASFEVSYEIANARLSLSPASDSAIMQLDPALFYTYEYSYLRNFVVFQVSMSAGSNVNVRVFTGDEMNPRVPNIEMSQLGNWDNSAVFAKLNYTYANPGDFDVVVNVSNALGYVLFMQPIRIISRVDGLKLSLAESPVR